MICPTCGEATDAIWHRRRDVPGALPAFVLRHRKVGGGWCESVRGPWLAELPNICTDGVPGATIATDSRSDRAQRATA